MKQELFKFIDEEIKRLAKESTAPDKETPDWLEADIRRGAMMVVDRLMPEIEETKVLNNALAAKILRQNKRIDELKNECMRLMEQQLDVSWEIEADEAGLDKSTQEEIKLMADDVIRAVEKDKKEKENLIAENQRLKELIRDLWWKNIESEFYSLHHHTTNEKLWQQFKKSNNL